MATAETHSAIRNSRVLVASSNESFRRLWARRPEYEKAEMEEAAGGADALAKLESENWGEVLLDRHLHDLDVDEVLHTIRERHPHLLVRVVDSDLVPGQGGDVHEPPRTILAPPLRPQPDNGRVDCSHDAAVPSEDRMRGIGKAPLRVEPLPG